MNNTENKTTYVVQEVVQETPDIATIKLTLSDGTIPFYVAGQFITVFFPEYQTHEGKAYTFSSAPHETTCNITVKNIGEFSGRLCSMKKGDTITASLPYGFFSSEYLEFDLILLAGGIGITPFRSIVLDALKNNTSRNIHIYYSDKNSDAFIFGKEFEMLKSKHPNVTVTYYVTQELTPQIKAFTGRIDLPKLISSFKTKDDKEFLICGSISFVRDMWKGLKEQGVDENYIYTEAFFK